MPAQKNPAISLCRVFSMFLIILCHIINQYSFIPGSQFLKEVLNVGVYTFLAISGYLYGQKHIDRPMRWLVDRVIKICIPSALLSVVVFACVFLAEGTFDFSSFAAYSLNLQGFAFILPYTWLLFSEVEVLAPLWFVTIIMLCYCMVPFLQAIRSKLPSFKGCLVIGLILIAVCFATNIAISVWLYYFVTFFFGYCMGHHGEKTCIRCFPFCGYALLTVILQIIRLYLNSRMDGTAVYSSFIGISHTALGICILCCFFLLYRFTPTLMERVANSKILLWLDGISLYVYMTHAIFCYGKLSQYAIFDNLLIASISFFILSFVSAIVLQKISNYFSRIIIRNK